MASVLMVDGHVHAYDAAHLPELLAAAASHFSESAPAGKNWSGLLLLADPQGVNSEPWLQALAATPPQGWQYDGSQTPLLFHFRSPGGARISVLRGQQLVTSEGLELLAIGATTPARPAPLAVMIANGRAAGHLVVVPWGVGKWLGKRGRLLKSTLDSQAGAGVLLGENGGRPWFWPTESLVSEARARAVPVLPGTDPLPLPGEEHRVGSMGAIMEIAPGAAGSAADLLARIAKGGWRSYGRAMGSWRFIRNQVGLRLARSSSGRRGGSACAS
jgi:hypothetical protein